MKYLKGQVPWNKGRKIRTRGSFKKGYIPWNKGKHGVQVYSEEMRRKMSLSLMGRKVWNKGIKGVRPSEETREKMSIAHKGKKMSEEQKKKIGDAQRGEKNHQWKGGITPEEKALRNGIEYRLWREAVFARDNWTCQKTGIRGGRLHPHHTQNFAQYPELRFAIDNGVALSEEAHREFHKKYGKRNNTKGQLKEFLRL